jgi:hypothetical protein
MADTEQHIRQWKHNRRFAKTIDSTYRDWQINVIFYTALHAVDAAIAKLGLRVTNHDERKKVVLTNGSFAAVRNPFLELYRISRITRYDADPDQWIPEKYLEVNDLVEKLLKPIENGLTPVLGDLIQFKPLPLET